MSNSKDGKRKISKLSDRFTMQNTVDDPIAKSAQYMIRIEMTLFLVLSLSLINCDHGQGVFHLCASKVETK